MFCEQNKEILDRRVRESVESRRPARTVREWSSDLPLLESEADFRVPSIRREPSWRCTSTASARVSRPLTKSLIAQIAGYDVRKQLSSVPSTLPVLVFHGTLDREFPAYGFLNGSRLISRSSQARSTTPRRRTSARASLTRSSSRSTASATCGASRRQYSLQQDADRVHPGTTTSPLTGGPTS